MVLPQPIDSTVFLAKEYRPRPLAFLKPFGVHVPRLCTPRSDVPTSTSVGGGGGHSRGVHIRGVAEEARLPFDSYATHGSNPPRTEQSPGLPLALDRPRRSPRRAAASLQQATAAPSGASSRAEVRALAARLEEGLARGGGAGALEEVWQGVELELVRQACAHCAERGELMEAARRRREAHAGAMRRQVAAQRLEPILSIP